jgi:hypothetical protein
MGLLFESKMRLKQRWGFVIFRTDYSSDADWAKFMETYRVWSQYSIKVEGAQRAARVNSWEQMWWMDDRAKYENASTTTLREHYHTWLAGLEDRHLVWPEHKMFLVVDAEVMERVRAMDAVIQQLPREQHPFVKVVDIDAPSESDDYPGWMKLSLGEFYYLYDDALMVRNMRVLRAKHTDWFDRDAPPCQRYLVESDDSDSSASDDEVVSQA